MNHAPLCVYQGSGVVGHDVYQDLSCGYLLCNECTSTWTWIEAVGIIRPAQVEFEVCLLQKINAPNIRPCGCGSAALLTDYWITSVRLRINEKEEEEDEREGL